MRSCDVWACAPLFIGAAGGLSGLLSVSGTRLESGGSLGMILSLVLGTLVGERLNLEGRLGQLGEWLKARASRGRTAALWRASSLPPWWCV